jgi:hypothetical protein
MGSDHEAEIRASVGAHRDLGPGYDDAVAEGLVERIGEEIDKRIDARLGGSGPQSGPQYAPPLGRQYAPPLGPQFGPHWAPAQQAPESRAPQPGFEAPPDYQTSPGYQTPPWYQVPPGYQAPPAYYQAPPPAGPAPITPWPPHRSVAATFIALGSMAMGVGATAIVAHAANARPGAQAVMVLLIWTAIAVINVAYARRR